MAHPGLRSTLLNLKRATKAIISFDMLRSDHATVLLKNGESLVVCTHDEDYIVDSIAIRKCMSYKPPPNYIVHNMWQSAPEHVIQECLDSGIPLVNFHQFKQAVYTANSQEFINWLECKFYKNFARDRINVWVVGSVAAGSNAPNDCDILIVFDARLTEQLDEMSGNLKAEFEAKFGMKLHLTRVSKETLPSAKPFFESIFSKPHINIYGRLPLPDFKSND